MIITDEGVVVKGLVFRIHFTPSINKIVVLGYLSYLISENFSLLLITPAVILLFK